MPLIICPECNKQISDAAVACIGCGYPINGSAQTDTSQKIQTIQQTGKEWKLGQLFGVLMVLVGGFSLILNAGSSSPSSFGPLMLFFGVIVWIGAKIGAWWHHH